MAINPVKVIVTAVDNFSRQMETMSKSLDGFGRKAASIGRNLSVGLSLPLVVIGTQSVKAATDYQASMSRVQAFSGATAQQMEELAKTSKGLNGLGFGSGQAAEGMKLMAESGFKANQIIAGMPGVAALARMGNMQMADAVDTVDNLLEGYGKRIEDINVVNDKLAITAQTGGIGVGQIAKAMTSLSPVAQTMGLGMEDLLTVVGALGTKGMDMNRAVMALKTGITSLTDPSKTAIETFNKLGIGKAEVFDETTGKMKPLVGMIELFREKGASATDVANIFGKQAGTVLNALISDTTGSLGEVAAAMDKSTGAANAMNDAWKKTAAGGIAETTATFETLKVEVGEKLIHALKPFLEIANKILDWFINLSPAIQNTLIAFGAFLAILGPALGLIGSLSTVFGALSTVMAFIGPILTAIAGGIVAISAPVWLVIAAFAAWGVAIYQLWKNWNSIVEVFTDLKLLVKTLQIMFGDLFTDIAKFILPKWAERLLGLSPAAGAVMAGTAPSTALTPGEAARTVTETNTSQSNVAVSFENAPKGMRVDRKSGDVDIDYSTGAVFAGAIP